MSFKDLEIKRSYTSYGNENIAKSFLVPALKQSKLYRRSVGFFSSGVFSPIVDGIANLARNNGHIQLIASPNLNEEDIEAINLGYKKRNEIIRSVVDRDFFKAIEELDDYKLQLLASLIANETLDIKIATTDGVGIYHDKLGILDDCNGNTLVFYGSSNETKYAYCDNYEKIRVVKSWATSDLDAITEECAEFDSLWAGTHPFVHVENYTTSAKKNVLTTIEKRGLLEAKQNNQITLRDYQVDAINAWLNNDYHGFFVMATGTGKTWTAIYSAKKLVEEKNAMIVICAPYKHLIRQWEADVATAIPNALMVMVSSENPHWEQQLTQAIVRQRIYKGIQIIVITTITSFNLDRFKKTIKKSTQEKLLIVDEAHRFTTRPKTLNDEYKYMLGLSATPFSGKSTEKGTELMNFFGGQVFDLPIEKALDKGFLVNYYYYPIFVNSTEEEELLFKKKTAQIAGCFKDGVCIDPENLPLYLRARLRIISMAQEKLDEIDNILNKVNEKNHFIIYCGDGKLYEEDEEIRHIQFVKNALSKLGFKTSQFTASESMNERMDLVHFFNEGLIDSLVAIRCLDEGINIPSITGALLLSSNDDYREFVQRRGRILRTYGNKQYANIYDVVVLPSLDTPKLAEIELRRFYEYARLAENSNELLKQFHLLAEKYKLDKENIIVSFEENAEVELDD